MAMNNYEKVWHNGNIISWNEATIHVASHVLSYGSCIFEGIRCYETPNGPAIFRLAEHTDRLVNSCKIYRMEPAYTRDQLEKAMIEVTRVNHAAHAYIRPLIFRGYGELRVNPVKNPIEVYILELKWGKYLGDDAFVRGIDVCISSWNRISPNTLPAMAKAAANYMNSQLVHMEAAVNGYSEGIALDDNGTVSEGSGENIFVVRGEKLYTPPLASSVLPGITRDSIITLALEMGIPVIEQPVPREMLYIADEVFFVGTAAEVTPIRSVDRILVGKGQPGPITFQLQKRFLAIAEGKAEDKYGWLTYCSQPVTVAQ
ncbi:MAG TPA: branched-chain amino acid transaminase [Terriglobia bacterium]|nr:branched-chain amino acid transaminase [Terriglobia bacterium]